MNIRADINRAFPSRRQPRRVRPRRLLTSRAWNDLVEAIVELQADR